MKTKSFLFTTPLTHKTSSKKTKKYKKIIKSKKHKISITDKILPRGRVISNYRKQKISKNKNHKKTNKNQKLSITVKVLPSGRVISNFRKQKIGEKKKKKKTIQKNKSK